jgi:hypothetical protein
MRQKSALGQMHVSKLSLPMDNCVAVKWESAWDAKLLIVHHNKDMTRHFEGAIRLPREILVAEDALGKTFTGAFDLAAFSLAMPKLPDDRDVDTLMLETPFPHDERLVAPMPDSRWGYVGFGKPADGPRPLASWVSMVVVKIDFSSQNVAKFNELATEFGTAFDSWYTLAVQWMELWTNQILAPDENKEGHTRGSVWDLSADPPALTGWGLRLGPVLLRFSESAVPSRVLQSSFAKATEAERPPPEWLIYLQARRQNDDRLAVIEAASAAEIALARAVDARLSSLSEAARVRITRNANGLAGLVQLLEAIDESKRDQTRWRRVADRLARPRNQAVHTGIIPHTQTTMNALEEAHILLNEYSPLPQP